MAVDQTGENILFVYEEGAIEVHIQIQYTGDPAKFGWVIPLQTVPDLLAAGSEALFQNMLAATVPQYGFQTASDDCDLGDSNDGAMTTAASTASDTAGGDDGGSGGEPEILVMQEVGAFEITVLTADRAQVVVDWLDANGYLQDEESVPILDQYLAEGHVFAAVKLTDGASLGEIHPIVFRFASNEPCVPLRLTAIAAVDDMQIRSFFLGAGRTVPRTYRHVVVNPLKIDWPNFAQNYQAVITQAVDADSADGRAFVTEYAGTSTVVDPSGIFDSRWNANAFRTLAAPEVMPEIEAQGFWDCGWDPNMGIETCGFQHPLLLPLLQQYLPAPDGVSDEAFYSCPSCYEDMLDLDAWDGEAFADEMEERIIGPGQRAADVLQRHPYLTRMYTTISPQEMTQDPMFWQNSALEDVPNINLATQRILCNGDSLWVLPDAREVYVPSGDPWPSFDDVDAGLPDEPTAMPVAERIAEVPQQGAPMELVNNTEIINAKLTAYNDRVGWNGQPIDNGDDPADDSAASGSGCGCRLDGNGVGWLWAGLLGLGVAVRRRRLR